MLFTLFRGPLPISACLYLLFRNCILFILQNCEFVDIFFVVALNIVCVCAELSEWEYNEMDEIEVLCAVWVWDVMSSLGFEFVNVNDNIFYSTSSIGSVYCVHCHVNHRHLWEIWIARICKYSAFGTGVAVVRTRMHTQFGFISFIKRVHFHALKLFCL